MPSSSSNSSFNFSLFLQFLKDQRLMMAHHLMLAFFFIPLMMQHLSNHDPGDLVN